MPPDVALDATGAERVADGLGLTLGAGRSAGIVLTERAGALAKVVAGVYYARLVVGQDVLTQRIVVLR